MASEQCANVFWFGIIIGTIIGAFIANTITIVVIWCRKKKIKGGRVMDIAKGKYWDGKLTNKVMYHFPDEPDYVNFFPILLCGIQPDRIMRGTGIRIEIVPDIITFLILNKYESFTITEYYTGWRMGGAHDCPQDAIDSAMKHIKKREGNVQPYVDEALSCIKRRCENWNVRLDKLDSKYIPRSQRQNAR